MDFMTVVAFVTVIEAGKSAFDVEVSEITGFNSTAGKFKLLPLLRAILEEGILDKECMETGGIFETCCMLVGVTVMGNIGLEVAGLGADDVVVVDVVKEVEVENGKQMSAEGIVPVLAFPFDFGLELALEQSQVENGMTAAAVVVDVGRVVV